MLVACPWDAWRADRHVLFAALFGGLFATAANNVLLARANKHLGSTVANLYAPVQPMLTAVIDYVVLGDAVYVANAVCAPSPCSPKP